MLVYLVTRPSPMDFRLFLLRHTGLLRVLCRWTIRLLIPRPLARARPAHLHAAREHLAMPLQLSNRETLTWLFTERRRLADPGAVAPDPRYRQTASAFRAPRFQALYRQWLDDPDNTLWLASSPCITDALARDHGQVECVELSRQYLHLSPLVELA